jgi:hypothetical protein
MDIARLGIVGSGIMGSGIAEVAAKAGVDVVLRSRQQATADAMLASLEKSLAKQVERGKLGRQRPRRSAAGSPPPPTWAISTTATSCSSRWWRTSRSRRPSSPSSTTP